ncbi:MAG: WecB/TagA/CpsF family glycosyltransferase, partial [Bacilli bacterium]|nr:WecB/TagA/CpsF family glycosyltransferase [Bacilli bacterium]
LKIGALLNGYSKDKDKDFETIFKTNPDIVLVALGMGNQEKLIYRHLNKFKKGIFVGVGGSLDVLSGTKKRAPKIFIKLNLEWLYRICKEPKRIKRFYQNNIKFLIKLKKDRWKDKKI